MPVSALEALRKYAKAQSAAPRAQSRRAVRPALTTGACIAAVLLLVVPLLTLEADARGGGHGGGGHGGGGHGGGGHGGGGVRSSKAAHIGGGRRGGAPNAAPSGRRSPLPPGAGPTRPGGRHRPGGPPAPPPAPPTPPGGGAGGGAGPTAAGA